jgi:hypothetical protein
MQSLLKFFTPLGLPDVEDEDDMEFEGTKNILTISKFNYLTHLKFQMIDLFLDK